MFKKIKMEWVCLLLASIVVSALSATSVFAYFSDDRWTAFGVVGTWTTGILAGVIAGIQLFEIASRRRSLADRAVMSIQLKVTNISDFLFRALVVAGSIITTSTAGSTSMIPDHLQERIRLAIDGFKEVTLEPLEKEHLSIDLEIQVNYLNADIRSVRKFLNKFIELNGFVDLNTNFNRDEFFDSIDALIDTIHGIDPDTPYVNVLRSALENFERDHN